MLQLSTRPNAAYDLLTTRHHAQPSTPEAILAADVLCLCPSGTNFTSGALYSNAQRDAAAAAEKARLKALRDNEELPLVYFDVAIKGQHVGRIHFVLFTKEAPRAGMHSAEECRRT